MDAQPILLNNNDKMGNLAYPETDKDDLSRSESSGDSATDGERTDKCSSVSSSTSVSGSDEPPARVVPSIEQLRLSTMSNHSSGVEKRHGRNLGATDTFSRSRSFSPKRSQESSGSLYSRSRSQSQRLPNIENALASIAQRFAEHERRRHDSGLSRYRPEKNPCDVFDSDPNFVGSKHIELTLMEPPLLQSAAHPQATNRDWFGQDQKNPVVYPSPPAGGGNLEHRGSEDSIVSNASSSSHPIESPDDQGPGGDRPYKCPVCDWSFLRSSDQKRHTRSHKKPLLKCPYWEVDSSCHRNGGAFNRLDVLKRHLRLVHYNQGSDNAPGSCKACTQTFASVKSFIDHCQECAARISEEKSHQ